MSQPVDLAILQHPEIQKRISGLSVAEAAAKLLKEYQQALDENKLEHYKPWPKQREFHRASAWARETLFRAINQVGKTYAAAMQAAIFATGMYPDWWEGKVFDGPTKGWVISESMQFSRDNAQRLLLGEVGKWGTGAIPKKCLEGEREGGGPRIVKAAHSVSDAVDMVFVKHLKTGKDSVIMFKSAEVEQNKLGGDTIDWAWPDEEPPQGHYEELLTRTNVRWGPVFMTFTPLKGSTQLVNRFIVDKQPGSADICWTIDDENLYDTPEKKQAIKDQYRNSRDRDARLYAKPILGSGNVFHAPREMLEVVPFAIPDHWPRICGQDFGWTHPAALAWLAFDMDSDTTYLYDVWTSDHAVSAVVADVWRQHGGPNAGTWIPIAWPQDGDNETQAAAGVAMAQQQRDEGMFMLEEPAMLPERNTKGEKIQGRKSVEAQVQMMDDQMLRGKFKVFKTCEPFWKEYDLYHRNDQGAIVKKNDDVISGTRYGWVMKRFAVSKQVAQSNFYRVLNGPENWRA